MSDLPVNIDSSYNDDPGDATVALHQQHHDAVHTAVNTLNNAYDDAVLAGFSGTMAEWLGTIGAPGVAVSTTAPSSPATGDLWYDTDAEGVGAVTSDGAITEIVKLTQAQYDALTPVATTLYVIVG